MKLDDLKVRHASYWQDLRSDVLKGELDLEDANRMLLFEEMCFVVNEAFSKVQQDLEERGVPEDTIKELVTDYFEQSLEMIED